MYSVDKGIAITNTRAGRGAKFPWAELKVNDSFFIPCEGEERIKKMKIAHNSIRMWLFARHRTFADYAISMRRVTEDGVDGIRVWRIK